MRLIDADLLDKKYREIKAKNGFGEDEQISHKDILSFTLLALDSLPTVDAVEVVRCKDCANNNKGVCEFWFDECEEDGFCSFGYAESKGGAG